MESTSIHRLFDDGGLLVIELEPAPGAPRESLALGMAVCTNPECACAEIDLEASRVEGPDGGPQGPPLLAARLDLGSGALSVLPNEAVEPVPGLADRLSRALETHVLDVLRERWRRVKGQGRHDEWRTADWSEIERDALVPYIEVFPSSWDLSVVLDGRPYWAVDAWCLTPKCGCAEIAVDLLDGAGSRVGSLRLDVRRFRIVEVRGDDPRLGPLGRELLADPDTRDELNARRRRIREVARALPRFLAEQAEPAAPAAPQPGRNAPCPCGSGRKYKRCCGR